uniref:SANT domain-containing protein n=1 Tax=Elaeophora elaphi TaxID=1147741 RepID=A0A0R3RFI9_9BILA
MHNETVNKQQQQQQEPSFSQSQSSSLTSTDIQNDKYTELLPVEDLIFNLDFIHVLIEARQRGNRSGRTSSDRSRRVVDAKEDEQVRSGKFDFGDRDRRPVYNITLPPLKEDEGKEWTIDELKTLHSCINSYGVNDNCLFHATKSIPNRSMLDIREKISGIRELTRLRHEMRVEARKTEWLKEVILPSKTSEIQDWSTAVHVIQNRKRRINDYTDSALLDYLAHEVKCRPASVDTRKYFRITDSSYARGANRRQVVDCADFYRFLQTCLSGMTTSSCKPFDSAIILNILEEIQKEVDDPKYEKKRRLLAGMFRDIQSGDLSDYDFRDAVGSDDLLCVQLNPLILMRDMLEVGDQQC